MVSWGHWNVVLNMILPIIFIIKSITGIIMPDRDVNNDILLFNCTSLSANIAQN